MRERRYYIYMMMSSSRRALYTGMTSGLERRVAQHKSGEFEGFTSHYNATRLVYYESYDHVRKAINREKQLKGWRREKKLRLIETINPKYRDLSADWGKPIEPLTPENQT